MTKVQKPSKNAQGASRHLMRQSRNREAPKQPLRSQRHSLGVITLGHSEGALGTLLGSLGALLGHSWSTFRSFGGPFWEPWGSMGDFLDPWGTTKSYIPLGWIRAAYFWDLKSPKWSKMPPQREPKWSQNRSKVWSTKRMQKHIGKGRRRSRPGPPLDLKNHPNSL